MTGRRSKPAPRVMSILGEFGVFVDEAVFNSMVTTRSRTSAAKLGRMIRRAGSSLERVRIWEDSKPPHARAGSTNSSGRRSRNWRWR